MKKRRKGRNFEKHSNNTVTKTRECFENLQNVKKRETNNRYTIDEGKILTDTVD